jgi:hypothetical protein
MVVAIAPPTTAAVAVPVATVAMVLVSARHPSPHDKKRVELARRRHVYVTGCATSGSFTSLS